MKPTYTEAEWKDHLPKLQDLPERTIRLAHAQLVEGQRRKDLAEAFDLSLAHVSKLVSQVKDLIAGEAAPSPAQVMPSTGDPARVRYSAKQWQKAVDDWTRAHPTGVAEGRAKPFPANAWKIAQAILVQGHLQQDVADFYGVTQSVATRHMAMVAKALEPYLGSEVVPVLVWVRPEGVAPLKAMSSKPPIKKPHATSKGRRSKY